MQAVNAVVPIRMSEHTELIGADYCEHSVLHPEVGVSRAVSVIGRRSPAVDLGLVPVGANKGEPEGTIRALLYVHKHYALRSG